MITATVEVRGDHLLDAYADLMARAPEVTRTEVDRAVNRVAPELLADLRRKPGAVKYPLVWQSPRQRRAYFASNGFGQGIPYRRSDGLINAYKVEVIYTPGGITSVQVTNDNPAYPFVKGEFQQRMHAITGWNNDADVFAVWSEVLADDVETGLIKAFYAVE